MLRRIVLGLAVAALSATTAFAQDAPAAAPSPFAFPGDGGVILNFVQADKAADFEMVLGKVKEGLAKSETPERKAQAVGWKVFKAAEAGPGGAVIYVYIMDPVTKNVEYSVGNILVEAFGAEGNVLYKTYSDAYATPAIGALLHLTQVIDLGK
jgi:hypothetical protein